MPPAENNNQVSPKLTEIVSQLKEANNILVTVSNNPSVDQLAACIGLTLAFNKQGKHATAVFSGAVPSTIEFLEPGKTIEKNTDSLRDFIISLDKNKADKLRYKVEDDVVKIFITPYKTSISDKDLDFSQGDFNVDVVLALGVHNRSELDAAIVAHGRILHDATIISMNTSSGAELGSIHWDQQNASSLSEMSSDLIAAAASDTMDSQIATAFLTGIVAETDRFRNEKSSPHTMSVSGSLMQAGASTQLVSSKLEQQLDVQKPKAAAEESQEDNPAAEDAPEQAAVQDDGTIQINHDDDIHIDETGRLKKVTDIEEDSEPAPSDQNVSLPEPTQEVEDKSSPNGDNKSPSITPYRQSNNSQAPSDSVTNSASKNDANQQSSTNNGSTMIHNPPSFGGQLTANSDKVDQQYLSAPDPLTSSGSGQMLTHSNRPSRQSADNSSQKPNNVPGNDQTLSDIEHSLNSPHVAEYNEEPTSPSSAAPEQPDVPPAHEDYARDAVERAVQSSDYKPEPINSLGSNPLGGPINHTNPPNNDQNKDDSGSPPPPVPPPLPPTGA